MKTYHLATLEKALRIAAKEKYVILRRIMIAMESEDEWIENKIEEWIEEAKKEMDEEKGFGGFEYNPQKGLIERVEAE